MNLEGAIKNVIRDVPDFPKPGIMFKDVTPIFYDQQLCSLIVDGFVAALSEKPDAVIGIESRGFLFGFMVANRLDVPFILVRKQGKLPYLKRSVNYELEYGTATIEIHEDAIRSGWNVLIHDDLLATGGTAEAAARLVKEAGAQVSGFNFVIGLDFLEGKNKLIKHTKNITCLAHY
jgi:adenine phosphoribosyltransferase